MHSTLLPAKSTNSPSFVCLRTTAFGLLFLFLTGFSSGVFASIFYVKKSGIGAGTGSWANASNDLQAMIDAASPGDEVWVAAGTYEPGSGPRYSMKEGVKIYGGFVGNETSLTGRNLSITANKSVLDGNNGPGVLVNYTALTKAAVLDGFTITGAKDAPAIQNGSGASPMLVNLTVYGNQSTGIYISGSSPVLINCSFTDNITSSVGGGISISNASPTLINCSLTGNTAGSGGGIFISNSTPILVNCLISNNRAADGAGILSERSSSVLTNCTIAGGTAGNSGGGILNRNGSACKMRNSIVSGNNSGIVNADVSTIDIEYSMVQGENSTANNNIAGNNDPLFADAANGDYRLKLCSPVLNKGSNSYYAGGQNPDISAVSTDLDGMSRFYNQGVVDMGAYEYQGERAMEFVPGILFVKNGGTGGGNSWDCATADLQYAINTAASGEQVWVAGGSYPTSVNQPFIMKEGVKIYGGFAGTETSLAQRDLRNTANQSNLKGGPSWVALGILSGLTNAAVLDGFLISSARNSRGVYCDSSSPMLVNLTISGNSGGGMLLINSSPTLINCAIVGNSSKDFGGGMTMYRSSSPIFINCLIAGNVAGSGGAGIFSSSNDSGSAVFINCTITANSSGSGSGYAIITDVPFKIRNSIISGNSGPGTAVTGPLIIEHSSVEGTGADPANGNIRGDLDPSFENAAGGNYQLKSCSPAVDKGSNTYYAVGQTPDISVVTTDLAGNPRFYNNGVADMGAFEYQGTPTATEICHPFAGIWFVKPGGTGLGRSWLDARGDLLIAINAAASGDQVWVAGGIYQAELSAPFKMKEGVKIYGGFAGTETSLADRDLTNTANQSELRGNRRTSAIECLGLTSAVLDGFLITSAATHSGVLIINSSPKLVNLKIANNVGGGGITLNNSSPTLINCAIVGNSSARRGGGMNLFNSCSPILLNCLFAGNETKNAGGAIASASNSSGSPVLTNCTITNNRSAPQFTDPIGHAIDTDVPFKIRNSIIFGNLGAGTGAAINGPLTIENSLVEGTDADPEKGNIRGDLNPLFEGDYHLQPCSPAINKGSNTYYAMGQTPDISLVATDLAGSPRIRERIVDMGAYEFGGASRELALDRDEAAGSVSGDFMLATNGSNCKIVADLSPNGASPLNGEVTAKVWVANSQPANFLKRHYQITPETNAANATAKVTLYFTQQEFNDFNAVNEIKFPVDAADAENFKANLRIEKRSGVSGDGSGLPNSYSGSIVTFVPSDANGGVEWNADASRWEVSFDVTGFSGFFAKTTLFALPLNLISFTAIKETEGNLLQWSTAAEVNTDHFEIQSSADAKNFIKIATVDAAGSGDDQYTYNDRTSYGGTIYYRLKMSDLDGTYTYSKIISLTGQGDLAAIYPNPVGALVTFRVNDGLLKTTANLYDITGRLIQRVVITAYKQQINTKSLASGLYILKFADGTAERFLKD